MLALKKILIINMIINFGLAKYYIKNNFKLKILNYKKYKSKLNINKKIN
jgi:hypothetical protein